MLVTHAGVLAVTERYHALRKRPRSAHRQVAAVVTNQPANCHLGPRGAAAPGLNAAAPGAAAAMAPGRHRARPCQTRAADARGHRPPQRPAMCRVRAIDARGPRPSQRLTVCCNDPARSPGRRSHRHARAGREEHDSALPGRSSTPPLIPGEGRRAAAAAKAGAVH
ncbi:hypothetical protein SETIT_4G198000v2 [Setaria italica]|uniref:Uncharacterized protein n=1 Tax=Setaria italica TaxID=4555 RepID=A0A368QW13_SETIT|nr:hypothetical protein SETIT_4G198000v2 [Setaria italica]